MRSEARLEGLRWSEAAQLVAHAIEQGREAGLSVAVAIVDGGRELKAFGRDDDAMLVTTQLAIGKAYTACSRRRSTLECSTSAPGRIR